MKSEYNKLESLDAFKTQELWQEIGRRLNVTYGRVQMVFHGGKPSDFTEIDLKVKTAEEQRTSRVK